MKKSRITSLYNNIIYVAIAITLFDLARKYPVLWIVLFIYLFIIRNNKIKRYIYLSISLFFMFSSFIPSKKVLDENSVNAKVIDVYDSYSLLKSNNDYFLIYDTNYMPGDVLFLEGSFKEIDSNDIPYVFSFEKYMNNKGVYYYFNYYKIEKLDHHFNYRIIKYKLNRYIENNYNRSDYYKALILSENDVSNSSINNLGIAHMLCISGLHINLILEFFKKVFKLKDKYFIIPIFLYLVILDFKIALLRVFLSLVFNIIFKDLSKIDNLSLSYLVLLFINPNYIFTSGFILTYLVSFSFLLTKKYKLLVGNLVTIPLTVSFNDKINILSIVFNYVFSIVFKYLLIPLTFICFLVRPLDFIYTYVIESFEYLIKTIDLKYFLIDIPAFNQIEYLIYYFTLLLFLVKSKIYFFFYFIIHLFKGFIIIGNNLLIMDVGQGDSTIIYTAQTTVMIDCYKNSYLFLKKRGIKELDYLFLTHSHDDHIGALEDVLNTVRVKNIVISYYDEIEVENPIKVKSGDVINTGDVVFKVLGPINDSSNLNDISIVLQFDFLGKTFLYTGDMEESEEQDLINKYKDSLKSDVLKVAHHGSDTSTSEEFIKYVDPKYAIISVGVNNYYNHPASTTLEALKNVAIYQTKDIGSILFTGISYFHIVDL